MTGPETHHLPDQGGIPNSRLPVLVYHDVDAARDASECEELFARNGWLGAWVDGIYSFHHFHSTTHEVLGIVAGSASVILGGPSGRRFDVERGDVLVLPAGTGHCNAGSSSDLLVVGAYPNGMRGIYAAVTRASASRCSRTSRRCRCRTPTRCTARTARSPRSGPLLTDRQACLLDAKELPRAQEPQDRPNRRRNQPPAPVVDDRRRRQPVSAPRA
jgi:uncharacterized protein YjlB